LRRASILAALANAILLLMAVGGIAWEALHRLGHPEVVRERTVMAVAALGVVTNSVTALLFMAGRKEDININGVFLHMAADAVVSLSVVVTGLVMLRTGWLWLDPAVGLAIGAMIVWGTWKLLRESLQLAMDAVPLGVNLPDVASYLRTLPGVTAVHDLHIWAMSTTEIALTAHLVRPDADSDDALLQRISRELHDGFRIEHATIQIERGDGRCAQAQAGVV